MEANCCGLAIPEGMSIWRLPGTAAGGVELLIRPLTEQALLQRASIVKKSRAILFLITLVVVSGAGKVPGLEWVGSGSEWHGIKAIFSRPGGTGGD